MKYEDDIHNCTNERLAEMLDEYNDWRRGKLPYDQPGCPAPIKASGLGVLLDEISARLRTIEEKDWHPEPLFGLDLKREVIVNTSIRIEEFKPYLRPMSSMTEEEKKEYDILTPIVEVVFPCDAYPLIDWLNKKMFDYRGLISMGLALEAPEDMYNTKTE